MSVFLLILGLVLFIALVVLHEFGHFIMARRGGVEVEEFGIGFPPKAWGKRIKSDKGDYDFTINWLPLGGFVRLKGENDSDKAKGSFGAARLKTKIKIMLAGVTMNLLTAFLLFTFVALIGMPKLLPDQFTVAGDTKIVRNDVLVAFVEPDSPADSAGLKERDKLVKIAAIDTELSTQELIKGAADFPAATEKLAGHRVQIEYIREGEQKSGTTTLREKEEVEASKKTDDPKGYLGVVPSEFTIQRSTWSAPIVAAGVIKQFTIATLQGLWNALSSLFQGDTTAASAQVSGPVGIFVILRDGSLLGVEFILMVVAVISLTLAIMNALPIPALDGGRLFVTLLFRMFKKPLTKKAEERIHGTGFALLMLLFVLITVVDVKRFF